MVKVKDADRIERVAQLFEALHNKAAAIVVRTVGFCGIVHYAAADFLDLVSSKAAKAERDRIVDWLREAQVEAMKQGKLEASAAMTGFADALDSQSACSHDRASTSYGCCSR